MLGCFTGWTTLDEGPGLRFLTSLWWRSEEWSYWVIWVSIACAAHSGAATRIFSKRLLTWKHRDWICLSHVGRGSRADVKERERKLVLITQLVVLFLWCKNLTDRRRLSLPTFKMYDAIDLIDEAVHPSLGDHLWCDFLSLPENKGRSTSRTMTTKNSKHHHAIDMV